MSATSRAEEKLNNPCFYVCLIILCTLTHLFQKQHFSIPWKNQKTPRFSDIFRGQGKGALGTNGLSTIDLNTTQHLENKNISQIKQKIYYFKGSSFDIAQILKGILNEKWSAPFLTHFVFVLIPILNFFWI